jgi:enoyl-[acyl-carrier protein] reductase I
LKHVEDKSALRRNVTTVEVANTALFLASESSSGITGQIIYVDGGISLNGQESLARSITGT